MVALENKAAVISHHLSFDSWGKVNRAELASQRANIEDQTPRKRITEVHRRRYWNIDPL